MKYAIFKTKWGYFGILAGSKGLLRTSLPQTDYEKTKQYLLVGINNATCDSRLFLPLQSMIKAYFTGRPINFDKTPPLDLTSLSQFTQDILSACKNIKFAQKTTYQQLANLANHPKAARAVGQALAKNPLPLIIPCHRVISKTGKLTGFTAPGGIKLKQKLLNLEKTSSPG